MEASCVAFDSDELSHVKAWIDAFGDNRDWAAATGQWVGTRSMTTGLRLRSGKLLAKVGMWPDIHIVVVVPTELKEDEKDLLFR